MRAIILTGTGDVTPVCAVELEFYLIDDSGRNLQVPVSPRSGKRRKAAETLSIRALDQFDTFFTDLYDACEAMDIPADTAISVGHLGRAIDGVGKLPRAAHAAAVVEIDIAGSRQRGLTEGIDRRRVAEDARRHVKSLRATISNH